jgi:hypothetical protein
MLPAVSVAAQVRPPIIRLASVVVGEAESVRATAYRMRSGRIYLVRFRVSGATAATGLGCVASATRRVVGSGPVLHVGVAPSGVWCLGTGVLSVAVARRGAKAVASRLRVRPPEAIGQGDVVGHLVVGPTCPVERADDPCDPVARPDPVTLIALDATGVETSRTVTLGDGSFAFDLQPGAYTLHAERTSAMFPSIADATVVVTASATRATPQRVIVTGDTGIR